MSEPTAPHRRFTGDGELNMAANGRFDAMTALVTGGASGIGCAVASRLIAEVDWSHCGTSTKPSSTRRKPSSAPKPARNASTSPTPEEVERAAKDADAAMGHIDILVCSAGVAGLNADVVDYPIDEWKRVFDVNINGLFYCNRYVGSLMKARGYGRIVNVASVAGKEGNPKGLCLQCFQGGGDRLHQVAGQGTRQGRRHRQRRRARGIETPMLGKVDATHVAYMRSKIPMERFGTVDEVAALICWLASRECSFSTGAVFDLSGGRATY
jgi:Dehydrogenases with different specificities (related to short-chain alcohol dehydrogenases)